MANRVVAPPVAVGKLDRLAAKRETQELVAETDPEDRDRAIGEVSDRAHRVRDGCGVAGAVREKDSVRLELPHTFGRCFRGDHGHATIALCETPENVALHAVVV